MKKIIIILIFLLKISIVYGNQYEDFINKPDMISVEIPLNGFYYDFVGATYNNRFPIDVVMTIHFNKYLDYSKINLYKSKNIIIKLTIYYHEYEAYMFYNMNFQNHIWEKILKLKTTFQEWKRNYMDDYEKTDEEKIADFYFLYAKYGHGDNQFTHSLNEGRLEFYFKIIKNNIILIIRSNLKLRYNSFGLNEIIKIYIPKEINIYEFFDNFTQKSIKNKIRNEQIKMLIYEE